MRRLLLVSADRAEHGLLSPISDELSRRDDVLADWCILDSHADPVTNLITYREKLEVFNPDMILLPTDRNEIIYAAAYSFHKGFVNVHFHAGNLETWAHPDDVNRRAISLYSHILLCNMPEHRENLIKQGEDPERIFVTGSTAFDGIEYDDSVTPKEPFDLVVLHPDPTSAKKTMEDLDAAMRKLKQPAIWIYPNHDTNYEIIEEKLVWWADVTRSAVYKGLFIYKNLPRPQFLSLLKNCTRMVGNSSSFAYEGSVLNPKAKLIQIGERNKGLIVPKTETGGSRRIAELLASIVLDDKLRNKRMC